MKAFKIKRALQLKSFSEPIIKESFNLARFSKPDDKYIWEDTLTGEIRFWRVPIENAKNLSLKELIKADLATHSIDVAIWRPLSESRDHKEKENSITVIEGDLNTFIIEFSTGNEVLEAVKKYFGKEIFTKIIKMK